MVEDVRIFLQTFRIAFLKAAVEVPPVEVSVLGRIGLNNTTNIFGHSNLLLS